MNNCLLPPLPHQTEQAWSPADPKRSLVDEAKGVRATHTKCVPPVDSGACATRALCERSVCDDDLMGGMCDTSHNMWGEVFLTQRAAKLHPHNGRDAKRTLWLVLDGGANCLILQSLYKHWLSNLRVAPPGTFIKMNSHPEAVSHFGDLCVDVRDEVTGAWKNMAAENVAVVPGSDFNLVGWSFYAKQLRRRGVDEPQMLHGVDSAVVSVEGGESVTAKLRHGLFTLRARKCRRSTHKDAKADA